MTRILLYPQVELNVANVDKVLDEVRPYLIADGGDVELVEIDGLVVRLKLNGACGSCPSSTTTMRMGIEKRLLEKIPEIMEVEQVTSEEAGLDLTEENVEATLDEIRPYLAGTGGGERSCCTCVAGNVDTGTAERGKCPLLHPATAAAAAQTATLRAWRRACGSRIACWASRRSWTR